MAPWPPLRAPMPQLDVQFSAQNQVKTKKRKAITPAGRSMFSNFPKVFVEE